MSLLELLSSVVVTPTPMSRQPPNLDALRGVLGPWRDETLSKVRRDASGQTCVMVGAIEVAAARCDVVALIDDRLRGQGWVLYEEAPQWLRELYDAARAHPTSR